MATLATALDVRPLTGVIGATVHGIDLTSLSDDQWAAVHEAWMEHLVLFFPGQRLTPDAHVALGRRLGEPEIHPFIKKLDDAHPEIVVIDGERGQADVWHSDVTFSPTPPLGSILNMAVLPARGGDTMWTNQYLAYERLSAPLRDLLDGITAVHTAVPFGKPELSARHPAVRVHPVTGRRSLFVNRSFTSHFAELHRDESDALLAFLLNWCEQANFQVRYRWQVGDVAMWDNRCTQHFAVSDYEEMRAIQRVTVIGDVPVGPGAARWAEAAMIRNVQSNDRSVVARPSMKADPRANSVDLPG